MAHLGYYYFTKEGLHLSLLSLSLSLSLFCTWLKKLLFLSPSNLLHICRHHHGRRLPWRRWVNRTGIGVIPFVSANVHHEETTSHTHLASERRGGGVVSLQRWIINEFCSYGSPTKVTYIAWKILNEEEIKGRSIYEDTTATRGKVFYNQDATYGPI